jgi:hypothetical protein
VPQFGAADFLGSNGYNTGYFAEADGSPRPVVVCGDRTPV